MVARLCAVWGLLAGAALADPVEEARQDFLAGDHAAALAVLRPYAEAGDAAAQNMLGTASFYGLGTGQDCAAALGWLQKAADQGEARAMFSLARYLDTGCNGEGKDPAGAADWYRRAEAEGVTPAALHLAVLLARGRAGPGDAAEIEALLARAEAAGVEGTGIALARLLATGTGLPEDRERALDLLHEAAAAGSPEALRGLGQFYLPEDPAAAQALFTEARRLGSLPAALDLAEMHLMPGTYWNDPAEAWALCLWAQRKATPDWSGTVAETCTALKGKVPAEALAEGERRAAAWD